MSEVEPAYNKERWLTVGRIVSPQGLRGEMRISPASDFPERFTRPGTRWLQVGGAEPRAMELLRGRALPGHDLFVVKMQGVDSREQVEALVDQTLLVPASDRPNLAEGEFHWLDLEGLVVRLEPHGTEIGTVMGLSSYGNDLLEVRLKSGRQVMIPFAKAIVPAVYIDQGWLQLTPPQGLLEL